MDAWKDRAAFVTGGASGIGRALARALAARGAKVRVADVDLAGAQRVAAECGGSAVALDVRDADAVRAAIESFAAEHGRIDYLFNNAGIGVAGEASEIPLPEWRRVVDINVLGVVHGVLAAYPLMLRQGHGHIVNSASLAGLGPAPLFAPYALAKHAVVGLSTSLALEAEAHGVRVSALCPAAVETPLLDQAVPPDAGIPWIPDVRGYLTELAGPPYPVDRCAEDTLAAMARNEVVIVLPAQARIAWRLGRWFPALVALKMRGAIRRQRQARGAPAIDPMGDARTT